MKTITVKNANTRKVAVKHFKNTLKEVSKETSRYYAYAFRDYIKEVLEQQLYKWKALSPSYAYYKKTNRLDSRILISTGDYVDSIKVFKYGEGYAVGLPHKKHAGSEVYLDHLAKIQEFGTRIIPPRPHWRTALSVFNRGVRAKVK